MTILDKARLRQSVYELAENDDSMQHLTKSNRLEKQVSDFLDGLTSIYFNKEKNRLVWHNKNSSENSTDAAMDLCDIAGHLSQDLELFDEAISIAELSVRLNSSDGRSRVNLGHLYLEKDWFDKAIVEYEEAIRLDPDIVYAYEGLGNAYAYMGQFEKALLYFKKTVALDPHSATAHRNLGRIYNDAGLTDKAIEEFTNSLTLDPDNLRVYNDLGVAYARKGDLDEAIATYKLALVHDPNDGKCHGNLAHMYYKKGCLEEATKEYKIAIKLEPQVAGFHNNLGAIYAQLNQIDKAEKEFMQSLKIDPALKEAADNYRNMEKIKLNQAQGDLEAVKRKTKRLKTVDENNLAIPVSRGQLCMSEKYIEEQFPKLIGDVIAELQYIDDSTFAYLDLIPKNCGIRLICAGIDKEAICKEKAKKCSKERPYLEIIKIPLIHNRWLGSNESFFIDLGTDLKSSALYNQFHTFRQNTPKYYSKEVEQFEKFWITPEEELKRLHGDKMSKTLFFSGRLLDTKDTP